MRNFGKIEKNYSNSIIIITDPYIYHSFYIVYIHNIIQEIKKTKQEGKQKNKTIESINDQQLLSKVVNLIKRKSHQINDLMVHYGNNNF